MGQKTHPTGFRTGVNKTHKATWFANYGAYSEVLKEDLGNFNRGNDPEGIALVANPDNSGYWICTEQSKTDIRFHLYDRETLEYMTTMYLDNVSYTDGITTAYMHGKWFLYAVDNDAKVVAFELPEIN